MGNWTFLTNHARVMLFIAAHPDARLRDIAAAIDVTERTAFGVVDDLHTAGYVLKERLGGRNRYQIQHQLPLPDSSRFPLDDAHNRGRTVGELLDLLVDVKRAGAAMTTTGQGPRSHSSR